MATIREVASTAGVSLATASRVLGLPAGRFPVSSDTAKRVRSAAKQLGYRTNYHMRAVATGRADAVGFCAEVLLQPSVGYGSGNFYFDALRQGVEYITQMQGAVLVSLHPGKGKSALQRGIEFLHERRLDTLVVPGSRVVTETVHEFEKDATLPLVMVNPMVEVRRPRVLFDTVGAMKSVVAHLLELGHRHILWLGPNEQQASGGHREDILKRAALDAGMTCDVHRVPVEDLSRAHSGEELLYRARSSFEPRLGRGRPPWTAIVAFNDHYAIAAAGLLHAAGLRIPGDVSLVGFDNIIATSCMPPLTTVDHCFFEMGQVAGQLAAKLGEADQASRKKMLDLVEVVAPRLVVRQSTGRARGS